MNIKTQQAKPMKNVDTIDKNRYLLFCGVYTSKSFGWNSFVGAYDSIEDAKQWLEKYGYYDWCDIVDIKKLEPIHVEYNDFEDS